MTSIRFITITLLLSAISPLVYGCGEKDKAMRDLLAKNPQATGYKPHRVPQDVMVMCDIDFDDTKNDIPENTAKTIAATLVGQEMQRKNTAAGATDEKTT